MLPLQSTEVPCGSLQHPSQDMCRECCARVETFAEHVFGNVIRVFQHVLVRDRRADRTHGIRWLSLGPTRTRIGFNITSLASDSMPDTGADLPYSCINSCFSSKSASNT